jgi:hypothetical protein
LGDAYGGKNAESCNDFNYCKCNFSTITTKNYSKCRVAWSDNNEIIIGNPGEVNLAYLLPSAGSIDERLRN